MHLHPLAVAALRPGKLRFAKSKTTKDDGEYGELARAAGGVNGR